MAEREERQRRLEAKSKDGGGAVVATREGGPGEEERRRQSLEEEGHSATGEGGQEGLGLDEMSCDVGLGWVGLFLGSQMNGVELRVSETYREFFFRS